LQSLHTRHASNATVQTVNLESINLDRAQTLYNSLLNDNNRINFELDYKGFPIFKSQTEFDLKCKNTGEFLETSDLALKTIPAKPYMEIITNINTNINTNTNENLNTSGHNNHNGITNQTFQNERKKKDYNSVIEFHKQLLTKKYKDTVDKIMEKTKKNQEKWETKNKELKFLRISQANQRMLRCKTNKLLSDKCSTVCKTFEANIVCNY